MSIRPPGGWDDPELPQPQSNVHPALAPRAYPLQPQAPAQPVQQPQPVQYVYLPQPQAPPPQFISQTVIVQNNQSSSGCLWLFIILFPPLWPIALIIWLVNRSRSSVTVVSTSGYGTQQYPPRVTVPIPAVVAVCILAILAIGFIAARNREATESTTTNTAAAVRPARSQQDTFQRRFDRSFRQSCMNNFQATTNYEFAGTWADSYCSCALRQYKILGSSEGATTVCTEALKASLAQTEVEAAH